MVVLKAGLQFLVKRSGHDRYPFHFQARTWQCSNKLFSTFSGLSTTYYDFARMRARNLAISIRRPIL